MSEAPNRLPMLSRKIWAVLFAIFCVEIGLFLVIYPWTQVWDTNLLLTVAPAWSDLWFSGYFRGALSGLGLLNLYIAVGEIASLRRFRTPAGQASQSVRL